MASNWRAHVGPVIAAAVRPHRAEGWKAGPTAARYRGQDDNWAHVFLTQGVGQGQLLIGFNAGVYCPSLREVYGFRTNRSRPPHQDYWGSSASVAGARLVVVNTGKGHVPAPFDLELARKGQQPEVRLNWPDFAAWFEAAFEASRPIMVQLAADRALYDALRSQTGDLRSIRDAAMLGALLGCDDQQASLVQLAEELDDAWIAKCRSVDPEWKHHDRMKNPIMWSHRRFLRQLDQVSLHSPR